jgi:hypothetical protein
MTRAAIVWATRQGAERGRQSKHSEISATSVASNWGAMYRVLKFVLAISSLFFGAFLYLAGGMLAAGVHSAGMPKEGLLFSTLGLILCASSVFFARGLDTVPIFRFAAIILFAVATVSSIIEVIFNFLNPSDIWASIRVLSLMRLSVSVLGFAFILKFNAKFRGSNSN